ncbi:hypothetical protein RhiirA1_538869 [Rhizophagus irregularis]|uniref:BTB domain-containing protein n=2 Tax=Rhizophagus irregularis TaxID=588596 RepID=A0A2N0RF11_9GLOM|nr:hypothetical protein RhiirA1_538869 [Rhizophagus irregularis]
MSSMLIMLSDNNSNTIATSTIINQINVVNEESKNVEEQKSLLNKFPPPPKTTFPSKITTTPTSTLGVNNKDEYYDVLIRVGEQPDVKKFQANSKTLISKCNYFCTALSSNWARKENDIFIIEKPNIKPKVFEIVLRYICSGTIDWNMLEGEDFLGIWLAADEFMLDDLEKQVRELFEKKSEKLKSNFISIVKLVYQNDALERFRSNCVDIINTTTWFQDCHNFKTLDESIFQSLLSEEENFVHDGVIWNLLILWACSSKNPLLNTNKVMEWSDKEFELLKSRIEHFIPYIRFSMISRNDYYNHVLPYRRILPADTTNNAALQYYFYCLDEEGNPKPDVLRPHVILNDSNIINHTHVAMIGRWIDTGREKENCTQDSCSNSVISVDDNLSLNEDQEIPPCNITSAETTKNSNSRNEEKGSMKISWKQSSPLKKLWTLRKNRRPVYPNDSSSTTTPSTTKKENNNERLHVFSSSDTKSISSRTPLLKNSPTSSICYSSPQAFTYNFKLIYRGSRDGFDIESYNDKCSEQGATVVVTTMSHSKIILGGYYPVNTKSEYPYEVTVCSPDAFIFSFGEGDNPEEDAILSRVSKQYSQFAICRTVQGPGFGNYDLGIRLEYKNLPKKIVCNQKYYEKKIIVPNESNEFTFDDIEVFKIIKEEV